MNKNKVDFIADLLANKKLDVTNKEKLFTLSIRELQTIDTSNPRFEERIKIIEKKLGIDSTNSNKNEEIDSKGKEDLYLSKIENLKIRFDGIKYNQVHNPTGFSRFLKLFKVDNKSGLKELIHTPIEKDYDFYVHLDKVIFSLEDIISECESGSFSPKYAITWRLFGRIIKLTVDFYNYGRSTWQQDNVHPCSEEIGNNGRIRGSNEFLQIAKDFKTSIRFDKKSLQYDSTELFNILFLKKRQNYDEKYGKNRTLKPPLTENIFKNITVFFTDVLMINSFIKILFEDTFLHNTNINGNSDFEFSKKVIEIDFKRQKLGDGSGYMYSLIICDKNSFASQSPETIFKGLSGNLQTLNTICDWTIECFSTFDGKAYSINMLNKRYMETKHRFAEIKDTTSVNGFTHILTFYDIE